MESDHTPEAFSPPTTNGDTNLTQPSGEQPTSVDHINVRIGMLRQWLNEDRIKDGSRFVTNENIHQWLDEGIAEERRQAKIESMLDEREGLIGLLLVIAEKSGPEIEKRYEAVIGELLLQKEQLTELKQKLRGENNE